MGNPSDATQGVSGPYHSPDAQYTKPQKSVPIKSIIAIIVIILILAALINFYKSSSSQPTYSTSAPNKNSTPHSINYTTTILTSTSILAEAANNSYLSSSITPIYIDKIFGGTWSSPDYYSGSTSGINSSSEYFRGLNYMDPITNTTWENLSTNISIVSMSGPSSQFLLLVRVNYINSTVATRALDTEGKSFISYISRNTVGVNSTGPINLTLQNGASGFYAVLSSPSENSFGSACVIKYNASLVQLIFLSNSSINRSTASNDINALVSRALGLD
jgi:hypothetical protein